MCNSVVYDVAIVYNSIIVFPLERRVTLMSQILSLRIPDQMVERLDRFARRLGNGMTRTKAGVMLLEESLRESEFSFVEYRDSAIGRQPYLKGSGLAIWEVIMIARR